MTTFAEQRLVKSNERQSFWDAQTRVQTATFTDMKKTLPSDKQKKLMCSSEVLFRRLLSVSQTRDIDLKTVLRYELAAVPPALFNDDGSMRKTSKAELSKKLEAVCDDIFSLPSSREVMRLSLIHI